MTTTELTSATVRTIRHACGHSTQVEVDGTTKSWVKHHAAQPCYQCIPAELVVRLCGHAEQIERGFFSPRTSETAAMQSCMSCRH